MKNWNEDTVSIIDASKLNGQAWALAEEMGSNTMEEFINGLVREAVENRRVANSIKDIFARIVHENSKGI